MFRAHVQSFLQTLNLVCLLDLLVFDIPKSMIMLINAEMTPKRLERSERAKILEFFFLLCMWRLLWFLIKIEIVNKSFKYKVVHNFCVDHKVQNTIFRNPDEVHNF